MNESGNTEKKWQLPSINLKLPSFKAKTENPGEQLPDENQSRAGQGDESDELGAAHEQPESAGGGNRPERTDLRISGEPQQIHIPMEPSNPPGSISVSGTSEQLSMWD